MSDTTRKEYFAERQRTIRRRAKLLPDLYGVFAKHASALIPVLSQEEKALMKTIQEELQ